MKKYLLTLITLTFFLCEAFFTGGGMAFATPASLGNGVTWEISGTTLTIGYEGDGSGVMPDYASETGMPWNGSKTSITSIVVEEGVTRIGNYAFAGCTASESVSLPNSMEIIGYRAFLSNGFSSITIPENVIAIGDEAFKGCSMTSVVWNARNCVKYVTSAGAYTSDFSSASNPFFGSPGPRTTITSFTFGETAEIVPKYVCYSMSVLSSVTISDNVTTIGDYAFQNCSTLTAITIPESVETIGGYAFNSCTGITSITIPSSVTSIGTYAFKGSGLTSITIPNSVTSLGTYVFQGCTALASVTLPSEITALGTYAFEGCTALTSITIPSKVTSIGNYAFKGCTNLASVTVPNSVTSIGTYAFQNCSKLANITIPQGVTTIGSYTFDGCAVLVGITIPSSVTSIGNYAFRNCSTLVRVNFPSALTSIGTSAFENTPKLKSIPLASATSLTSIGSSAFALSAADATATGLLVIPSSVTSIGGNAFKNRSGLTGVVICNYSTSTWTNCSASTSFDGTPTNIPVYTYNNTCNNHYKDATGWKHFDSAGFTTSYTISSMDCGTTASKLYASLNLRTGSLTFSGSKCNMKNYNTSNNKAPWAAYKEAIKSVTINSYVQTIGEYAFYECGALATVTTSDATNLTSIGQRAFQYCRALTSITIPASVTSMNAYTFYDAGLTSVTWNATNHTADFTTQSPFALVHYTGTTPHPEKIETFTIGSGVTRIPGFLCAKLSGLTSITIPSNVSAIGGSAFKDCSALSSVNIQRTSAMTVANGAFGTCNAINSVKYSGTVDQWCDITWGNSSSNPTYWSHGLKLNNSDEVTTSVSISASSIGTFAFSGNTALTSVTLSSNVQTFNSSAFSGCTGLTSVRFNGTLAQWCDNTFANADANPLKNAHHFYLNSATELTNLEIPEAITSITDYAFYNGSGFESISVYSSTSWGANTFFGCVTPTILGDVIGTCGENLTWRLNGNTLYIENTGDMYNYTNNTSMPWYPYRAQIQNVVFENGATSVGNNAFNGLTNIQSVTFGSGITTIGEKAFYGCSGLTGTLTTGSGTKTIGNEAFENCTSLINVVLNNGMETLSYKAFYGCSNLISVTVPASLTTFNGGYIFQSCNNIAAVYYQGNVNQWCGIAFNTSYTSNPASYVNAKLYVDGNTETYLTSATISATSIGNYAFYNNRELESVTLSAATSIGQEAFYGCTSLQSITIPSCLTTMGSNAFSGCTGLDPENSGSVNFLGTANQWAGITFPSERANPAYYAQSLKLNNVPLENCTLSVNVNQYAFYGNKSLTTLVLNGDCASIGTSAFRECTNLTSVDMTQASDLTTINNYAFWNCTRVSGELFIPASVTTVGQGAFNTMSGITTIYAMPTTTPTGANAYTFGGFDKTIPFCVTSSTAASNYAAAQYWQDFTNVWYGGYCGAVDGGYNLRWRYSPSSHALVISGTGAMANYATASAMPWNDFKTSIASLVIEDGVTTIGDRAFYGCTALASVTFPETFNTLGNYAFYNCSGLTSIALPEGITATGNSLFYGCTSLASVSLPSTLTTIGSSAFHSNAFTSISIPSNVSSISSYAFKNCANLESISLPNITTLNEETFSGCSGLESVTLPNSLTSIKKNAFINCSTLVSITIPLNVTEIVCVQGSGSATCPFSGCTSLTSVQWDARNCGGFSRVGQYQEYAMPFESIKANINSFTFGENVTSIPTYVCHGMTGLSEITIPASVTSIGANAFNDCSSTMSVTCEGTTPPTLASGAFSSPSTKKLYLPHDVAAKAAYRAASGWSSFTEANTFPKIVQFSLNGKSGDAIDPQYFDNLTSKASVPSDDPSADYYTFGGWYENAEGTGSAFAFSTTNITADKILYAKWTEDLHSVTVAYKCGEATIQASGSVSGVGVATAQNATAPEITGYTFSTWSAMPSGVTTSDELTSATISINATADDKTITANYTINSYDVTFDLQGHGSSIAVQSVNYNGLVSEPSDPEADYYTFGGWYEEAGCENAFDFSTPITADKTLYAKWTLNGLALDENADNSSALSAYNGQMTNVTMTRSLTNAQYNTFCLPFSLTADQMEEAFGAGYDLEELTGVTYDGESLALEFTQREALEAGKPYLLRPTNNVANPSFSGVEISNAAPSDGLNNPYIEYRGVYSPALLEGGNHNLLFLGAGNELFWPASNGNLKGFRAYFIVKSPALGAMRARIVKKEDTATGIDHIQPSAVSSQKYIKDGILYIERDGKTFNAQGQRIK